MMNTLGVEWKNQYAQFDNLRVICTDDDGDSSDAILSNIQSDGGGDEENECDMLTVDTLSPTEEESDKSEKLPEDIFFEQCSNQQWQMIFMINDPVVKLLKLAEDTYYMPSGSFSKYEIHFFDQKLDFNRSLLDQCPIQEVSGYVQLILEVKGTLGNGRCFNILDIMTLPSEGQPEDETAPNFFMIDPDFRALQSNSIIPKDPKDWLIEHVQRWVSWAAEKFSLDGVDIAKFAFDGRRLLKMNEDELLSCFPHEASKNFNFIAHLRLLRQCGYVTVPHTSGRLSFDTNPSEHRKLKYTKQGFNGQLQVWQFLLELLTDRNHRDIIEWVDDQGVFKMTQPEKVAQLWGLKKCRLTMTYEKMARALRNYKADGNILTKVGEKKKDCNFHYQFTCDMESVLGFTVRELMQRLGYNDHSRSTSSLSTLGYDRLTTKEKGERRERLTANGKKSKVENFGASRCRSNEVITRKRKCLLLNREQEDVLAVASLNLPPSFHDEISLYNHDYV